MEACSKTVARGWSKVLEESRDVHLLHAWYSQRSKETMLSPGTGVPGSCELPYGWWELNISPPLCKSSRYPLTAGPSLQPPHVNVLSPCVSGISKSITQICPSLKLAQGTVAAGRIGCGGSHGFRQDKAGF